MLARLATRFSLLFAAAFLTFGGASASRATLPARIGPSFDCEGATQPLALMICASPELSRLDLRFVQVFQALLYQVGKAGRSELWQEAITFQKSVLQECGIPEAGPISGSPDCLAAAYERKLRLWLSRLEGAAREEAIRPIREHVALQAKLHQLGFLPATAKIDGVYGPAARAAILAWQGANGRPETGFLGNADASALEGAAPSVASNAEAPLSASATPAPMNAPSAASPAPAPEVATGSLFDCSNITLPSTAVICGDPELRRLAAERQAAFNEAMARLGSAQQKELLADQTGWVRSYATACGVPPNRPAPDPVPSAVKECFEQAGRARVAYLRAYGAPLAAPPAAKPPAAPSVMSGTPSAPASGAAAAEDAGTRQATEGPVSLTDREIRRALAEGQLLYESATRRANAESATRRADAATDAAACNDHRPELEAKKSTLETQLRDVEQLRAPPAPYGVIPWWVGVQYRDHMLSWQRDKERRQHRLQATINAIDSEIQKESECIKARQFAKRQQYIKETLASLGYKSITVRYFLLDGEKMATTKMAIAIAGYYYSYGENTKFFTDSYIVQYGSGKIPLITNNAARDARSKFLDCHRQEALVESGSGTEIGCQVGIVGYATTCIVNLTGSPRPCIEVVDLVASVLRQNLPAVPPPPAKPLSAPSVASGGPSSAAPAAVPPVTTTPPSQTASKPAAASPVAPPVSTASPQLPAPRPVTTPSGIPIEKDAIFLDPPQADTLDAIDVFVRMVKANGYRCSSISAFHPFAFSRGFELVCNDFTYTYDFADKGRGYEFEPPK